MSRVRPPGVHLNEPASDVGGEPATLIQGVVGSNLAAVISSVLPQGWGVGLHT